MAQRIVELVIGRLVTDEDFRSQFVADAERTLLQLRRRGFELTPVECAALVTTDRSLWQRTANRLDSRLRKPNASLTTPFQKVSTNHV